ncbi:MAG: hypothetical protein SVU32_04940 [Candidatus Nanohaloarchaea archaeon]|nr:hypothetical protein [Candidatus Nanohaloarchaea archaeon]
MEMELQDTRDNPALEREEHTVRIEHSDEATPSEDKVRKKFAAEHDYDPKKVEVRHVYTGFGSAVSEAEIRTYEHEVVEEEPEPEEEEELEEDDEDTTEEEPEDVEETAEDEPEEENEEAEDDA